VRRAEPSWVDADDVKVATDDVRLPRSAADAAHHANVSSTLSAFGEPRTSNAVADQSLRLPVSPSVCLYVLFSADVGSDGSIYRNFRHIASPILLGY